MGQVAVTLNDRVYRLVCDDGEEDRLVELAGYVKSKVEQLTRDLGHVGDERLMLMAALIIADELFDARAEVRDAVELATKISPIDITKSEPVEPEPVRRLKSLAARIAAEQSGAAPPAADAQPAPPTKPRRRDVA